MCSNNQAEPIPFQVYNFLNPEFSFSQIGYRTKVKKQRKKEKRGEKGMKERKKKERKKKEKEKEGKIRKRSKVKTERKKR